MTLKCDAKFGGESTCCFKTFMRNLANFDTSTRKSKSFWFNGLFLTKVYNVWAKESTEELCLIEPKIHAKVDRKLSCTFKNDIMNLKNFHRLKNSNFILESKMAQLNQNKNSNKTDQPYLVWKFYFTLEKYE